MRGIQPRLEGLWPCARGIPGARFVISALLVERETTYSGTPSSRIQVPMDQ